MVPGRISERGESSREIEKEEAEVRQISITAPSSGHCQMPSAGSSVRPFSMVAMLSLTKGREAMAAVTVSKNAMSVLILK